MLCFSCIWRTDLKAGGNVLVSMFLGAQASCGVTEVFPRRETRVWALRNFHLTFFWWRSQMFHQYICSVGVSVEYQPLPVSVCTGSVWTQSWILVPRWFALFCVRTLHCLYVNRQRSTATFSCLRMRNYAIFHPQQARSLKRLQQRSRWCQRSWFGLSSMREEAGFVHSLTGSCGQIAHFLFSHIHVSCCSHSSACLLSWQNLSAGSNTHTHTDLSTRHNS